MKNFNLNFKSIVQSKARWLLTLFAILALGVGKVWAGAGLYEAYFEYSYNGTNTSATYTDKTSSTQTIALGTLTADFKITSMYPKVWKDGSGNICGCLVEYYIDSDQEKTGFTYDKSLGDNNHQWKYTSSWTIASYNSGPSGSYTFWYRFKAWGSSSSSSSCDNNQYYIPTGGNKNKFTYNIAPPAISSFSVAKSGYISGSGTYGDPYLVAYNGMLTFTVSGSKARTDANSTIKYWLNSGTKQNSNELMVSGITSTDLTSVVVHTQCINNSSSSLVGTESTETIYYKVATYAITLDDNGDYVKNGSATASYLRNKLTEITAPQRTGYHVAGYYGEAGCSTPISDASGNLYADKTVSSTAYTNASSQWVKQSATTLYADWEANIYTMTLKHGLGGTGSDGSMTVAYDATAKSTMSYSFTNTGYHISGWYPSEESDLKVLDADGTFAANNVSGYITSGKWSKTSNGELHAHWAGNAFTVEFDKNGGTGTMADQDFVYGTSENLTANAFYKDGYQFDGWATTNDGAVAYANGANGCTITSTADATVTLYAHWTKVEVENLTFEPATSAGSTSVTVTPTLSGTPTGSSSICWGLFYDSECTREVPNISFSPDPSSGAGSATFTCPAASGSYYVKATYRAGSDCNGTVLNTFVKQYVVASEHTVVIKYTQGSTEIASRGNVVVPAASSAGVKAPEIFGYTFSSWSLSEGLSNTCADGASCGTGKDSINISAVIDATLTANYTRKSLIYFKNTLGWSDVYVHFLGSSYWDTSNGTGNNGRTDRNKHMTRLDETDIWYFDYGAANITPNDYLVFTDRSYDSWSVFHNPSAPPAYPVVYPIIRNNAEQAGKGYGFNAGTPMFVPLNQTGTKKYSDKAIYYNEGYWREFVPATGETGYTLEIYNKTDDSSRDTVYTIPMTDATGADIFEATVILEAGKTGASKYGVKFRRDNGMRYTANGSTLAKNGSYTVFSKQADSYAACGMETTIAGEYTFRITCANDGTLKMAVTYPAAAGDYRLIYKDNDHPKWHPSDIVRKVNNSTDIVSFFVRTGSKSQSLQMQNCAVDGSGNVTWSNYGVAINPASTYSSVITKDGVYNFHLSMDNNGALSIDSVTPYTGNFYIRTDVVGGTKWADFRNASHQMTYSDYAKNNEGYSHYYMHWVTKNTNVKFTVANDYSPCISDTLAKMGSEIVANMDAGGTFSNTDSANVRFMYNDTTNEVSRAYLAGAQTSSSYFLVLSGQENNLMTTGGAHLVSANNGGVGNDEIQLSDDRDWIYKTSVKAKPGGLVKLYAKYGSNYQYFIGKSGAMDASHAEALIGGDGDAQVITVVYDFKTNRMIAAWEPADTIEGATAVNADIIIVREHQGASNNIVFKANEDNLSTEKTVYGVMRFNKYKLNNRSTTGTHEVLPVGQQLPLRERNHYYVSFPFDVNVSDIFGFGTYGVHWVLQYYDGVARAKNGLWADPGMTYWKYVPPTGKLKANEGYLLALSPSQMAYNKDGDGEVWSNGKWEVELYFPDATKGATIGVTNVTIPAPGSEYVSVINRGTPEGDRTIKDSYWRCIGVPSFKDYTTGLTDGSSALAWSDPAAYETGDIHFLYEVQWADNSLRAVSGDTYKFKAMHAYMVQNSTAIVWSSVSAIKSIVARRQKAGDISNYEFRLTLNQNDEVADQTFVRLTDDENVTNGFEFGHDMSKEMYSTKANIFTYIGYEPVAANSMPFTEQTTVVPVGIKVVADGDYTFAMPDGTSGVGVTLVDNVENIRTSLSALDYTVHLAAGDYTNRFTLEISPIKETPTGVEEVTGDGLQVTGVRKVLIDGILYIVKDNKMYDARGNQVK